jgi:hypothetical protein
VFLVSRAKRRESDRAEDFLLVLRASSRSAAKSVRLPHLPETFCSWGGVEESEGGSGMSPLEWKQRQASSDERYTRQARREILGPDFSKNANLFVPPDTLSRIAARADELKREETQQLAHESTLPFEQLVVILRYRKNAPLWETLAYLASRWSEIRLPTGAELTDGCAAREMLELLSEAMK